MGSEPQDEFWPKYEAAAAAEEAETWKTRWITAFQWRKQLSGRWATESKDTQGLKDDICDVMSWLDLPGLKTHSECVKLLKDTIDLENKSQTEKNALRRVDSALSTSPPPSGVLRKLARSLSDSFSEKELSIGDVTSNGLVTATLGLTTEKSAKDDDVAYDTAVERVKEIYKRVQAYTADIEQRKKTEGQPST